MLFTSIGLVVSVFGFKELTDKLYPLMGYLGSFLVLYGIYQLVFKRKIFRRHILRFKILRLRKPTTLISSSLISSKSPWCNSANKPLSRFVF